MEPGISIPILPARDLAETRDFYERLGFQARLVAHDIRRLRDSPSWRPQHALLFVQRDRTRPELRAVLLACKRRRRAIRRV